MQASSDHANIEYNARRKNVYRTQTLAMQELIKNHANRKYFDEYGGKGKKIKFPEFNDNIKARLQRYSKELDEIDDNGLPSRDELDLLCEKVDEVLRRVDGFRSKRDPQVKSGAEKLHIEAMSLRIRIHNAFAARLSLGFEKMAALEEEFDNLCHQSAPLTEFSPLYDELYEIVEQFLFSTTTFDNLPKNKIEEFSIKFRSIGIKLQSIADIKLKEAAKDVEEFNQRLIKFDDNPSFTKRELDTLLLDIDNYPSNKLEALELDESEHQSQREILMKQLQVLRLEITDKPLSNLRRAEKKLRRYEGIYENLCARSGDSEKDFQASYEKMIPRFEKFNFRLADLEKRLCDCIIPIGEDERQKLEVLKKRAGYLLERAFDDPNKLMGEAAVKLQNAEDEYYSILAECFPKKALDNLMKSLSEIKLKYLDPVVRLQPDRKDLQLHQERLEGLFIKTRDVPIWHMTNAAEKLTRCEEQLYIFYTNGCSQKDIMTLKKTIGNVEQTHLRPLNPTNMNRDEIGILQRRIYDLRNNIAAIPETFLEIAKKQLDFFQSQLGQFNWNGFTQESLDDIGKSLDDLLHTRLDAIVPGNDRQSEDLRFQKGRLKELRSKAIETSKLFTGKKFGTPAGQNEYFLDPMQAQANLCQRAGLSAELNHFNNDYPINYQNQNIQSETNERMPLNQGQKSLSIEDVLYRFNEVEISLGKYKDELDILTMELQRGFNDSRELSRAKDRLSVFYDSVENLQNKYIHDPDILHVAKTHRRARERRSELGKSLSDIISRIVDLERIFEGGIGENEVEFAVAVEEPLHTIAGQSNPQNFFQQYTDDLPVSSAYPVAYCVEDAVVATSVEDGSDKSCYR